MKRATQVEIRRQSDGTYAVKVFECGAVCKVPTYALARRIKTILHQALELGMSNPYA